MYAKYSRSVRGETYRVEKKIKMGPLRILIFFLAISFYTWHVKCYTINICYYPFVKCEYYDLLICTSKIGYDICTHHIEQRQISRRTEKEKNRKFLRIVPTHFTF